MKKLLGALALIALSVPLASGQEVMDDSGDRIDPDVLRSIFQAMNAELRDGYSARYSRLVEKGTTVCGFVNARNAFGAYVGETAFLFRTRDQSVSILPSPGDVLFPVVEISFNSAGCDTGVSTFILPNEAPTPNEWQSPINGLVLPPQPSSL